MAAAVLVADEWSDAAEQEVLAAERHAALREAYSQLPRECQRLVAMLAADPPIPYAEISARLGIPVGSIGPTRRRWLDRMRRHPALAALINAESGSPRPVLAAVSHDPICAHQFMSIEIVSAAQLDDMHRARLG